MSQCNCGEPAEEDEIVTEIENDLGFPPPPPPPPPPPGCPTDVHQTVSIYAKVQIEPKVAIGRIKTFCLGDPHIMPYCVEETCSENCTFYVKQDICVEVPLFFEAKACAEPYGHMCHMPDVGCCRK